MVDVLETKRAATKFRILVCIAENQPAVSQGEIASDVALTNQAVSEYIRELVTDGHVEKEARSRYRVTNEGVDWLFHAADDVKRYADHVTEDILGGLREDAAIAATDLAAGQSVSLHVKNGLLEADENDNGSATGLTTGAAAKGTDVGVTGFQGVIDLDPGEVTVFQVPAIRAGGSSQIDATVLRDACRNADLVVCAGVEAVVATRTANITPDSWFAPGDVAADAAGRGLDVAVVATIDRVGGVTDALSDATIGYEIAELS